MISALKIKITIVKNGKREYKYPSYLKLINLANNKAKLSSIFEDNGHIVILVDYGRDFTNEKHCYSQADLKWCVEAFVREYL